MSDMTSCLNGLSYIPMNNEQNEPTQGDIVETSNDPTQAKRNEFEELYASANEELYPSCDYVTRLDFMAKFTYFKVKGKLTDSIFNEMLEFFQNVFPTAKGYMLPSSYYEIKKTFKMIGLGNTSGKKVPKKVLRYFSIIPRLQRLYKSSHTAKEMTWHGTRKCTEPGKMQHPVDGRAWKNFDTKYLNFAKEPRNVRLWLVADGLNPFGNLSQSYSMLSVILTTYNMPPWLCMKESSFRLTLLIPGPKSPRKDIDVYLRPLIDDLKDLWAKPSVETIDIATGQKFNMRAMVLWTINDFPARTYVGYRRFLKKPHKWRRSLEFNGEKEDEDPPREFGQDDIMVQLARLPTRVKGKHPKFMGVKIKHNVLVELNWTKRSIFYELEYWSFLTLKHNLEVMHIEKNVLESILNTLLINDRSKDTAKARQDLKRKKFCQFIKRVKLPDGFGSNFKHKVTDNDTNITGLKSHDCHIMMQRLLPYGLQRYLPRDVAKLLIELCLFFKQICSQTLMVYDMLKAQSKFTLFSGITKFNRPDHNVDFPPPTSQFQVFKSLCKSIGLRSIIRIDHQELKKVIWYVIHNSPEIDTYRAKFKSEFPNKDMKEEFPGWFGKQICQCHVDNDPVNGVRFVVHSRDERRTTQNSGICSPGLDREMYYGQLEQILEFSYLSFKTVLFRVKWFDTSNKGRIQNFVIRNNITQIKENGETFKNDQYILATPVKQCFYLEDMARRPLSWKVVEHVSHKKFSNGGVIVVKDEPDVIHVDNSYDLALSTSLNDLAALHIEGQSIDFDAPPDIIDVDEDDDIIDEEDLIPHDLAYSDDEDLVNLDIDDGVNVMSTDVARGHGGDGGGDDRPPPYQVPTGYGGCLGNRGKGARKPNLGGRRAGRMHTRQETQNLELKAITDKNGPVNYLGELVKEFSLYYPSWRQMPPEQKARVVAKIGTQFDLRPHIESELWPKIYAGIHQHLQKIYNGKKAALKQSYWVPDPRTELTTWSASDACVPRTFLR
ncbi:hypothetical protein Tco_0368631 [Tanacetum coccineum]